MAKVKVGRIAFRVITSDVERRLGQVSAKMNSVDVIRTLQQGGEMMAAGPRQRAPRRSGALAGGIYTVSPLKDNYRPIYRARGRKSQNVVLRPKYAPRANQVLIVGGTFYIRWIEYGRKARDADRTSANRRFHRRVGRSGRRRFFWSGLRSNRPAAEEFVRRRLAQLVEEAAR